jgi:sugar phosphate isomerase/epimerase
MSIQLAVSTYSLSRWKPRGKTPSLLRKIDRIAEFGVKAIEFAGAPIDQKPAALRRRAEKAGLTVVSYCVGAELLVPAARQKQVVAQLKREVDVAAELGCPSMRHDVTRGFDQYKRYRGRKTFAAALKIITPAIREVADYAQARGVITTVENHGFYMQAAERIEKLLLAVDHPNFALTMDMGNFLCVNDDPVAAVERLAKRAVMVHVKDFHVKLRKQAPASWLHTPTPIAIRGAIVGHGNVDIPAQLRALKGAGYDGYLSLEFEGLEEPTFAIAAGLDYLREQL